MDFYDDLNNNNYHPNHQPKHPGSKENRRLDVSALEYDDFSDLNSESKSYMKSNEPSQSNIQVVVRSRPLNAKERQVSNFETLKFVDEKVVLVQDPSSEQESNDFFRNNRNKDKQYTFDHAFDHHVDTRTIYQKSTRSLIPGILHGFNATIFAYGATGAGKTYTMMGYQDQGMMSLIMGELFNKINNNNQHKDFIVRISYLEVYNEMLRDLLSSDDQSLDIREDAERGMVVAGITELVTDNPEDVIQILKVGGKNRTMESTGANHVSSRSHAVLQAIIEHREKSPGLEEEIAFSKLSLIDLAGSERASQTNNKGQRMIEGANINKSLLALGNCINMLAERAEKGLGVGKNNFIPYRDSKLTRLLKDSLGGNCRTFMIANVSPSVIGFEDTLNTLKYANRAKNIKTVVSRNVLSVSNNKEDYTKIINNLKLENDQLKKQLKLKQASNPQQQIKQPKAVKEDKNIINHNLEREIKSHFEEEQQVYNKLSELELNYDDLGEKISSMMSELNLGEDQEVRSRMDDLVNRQRSIMLQIGERRREFEKQQQKRGLIMNKVRAEKNEDAVTYLTSIFQQHEVMIENLDYQHKERRVELQVKAKDRQIQQLQNQLASRSFHNHNSNSNNNSKSYSKKNSQVNHKNNNNYHVSQHFNTQESAQRYHNQSETLGDGYSRTDPDFDIDIDQFAQSLDESPTKIMKSAKNLILPGVKHSSINRSSHVASQKVLAGNRSKPKKGIHEYNLGLNAKQNSSPRYYYNKMKYIKEKQKPYEGPKGKRNNLSNSRSPKIKRGYNSVEYRNQVNVTPAKGLQNKHISPRKGVSPERRYGSIGYIQHESKPTKPVLNPAYRKIMKQKKDPYSHSIDSTPRHRSVDLSDDSYVSTASTSQAQKNKILSDLNKRVFLPELKNSRSVQQLAPHLNFALRYGESPYVAKFNQKQSPKRIPFDHHKKKNIDPQMEYYTHQQRNTPKKGGRK